MGSRIPEIILIYEPIFLLLYWERTQEEPKMCMQPSDFDALLSAAKDTARPCASKAAKSRLFSETGLNPELKYGHIDEIRLYEAESRRRWASGLGLTAGTEVLHPRGLSRKVKVSRIDEEGYVILRGVRGRHHAKDLFKTS